MKKLLWHRKAWFLPTSLNKILSRIQIWKACWHVGFLSTVLWQRLRPSFYILSSTTHFRKPLPSQVLCLSLVWFISSRFYEPGQYSSPDMPSSLTKLLYSHARKGLWFILVSMSFMFLEFLFVLFHSIQILYLFKSFFLLLRSSLFFSSFWTVESLLANK